VIVIVIAIIVVLWLRGFLPDAITKFGDENIELACDKVVLDARLNPAKDTLSISNNGNVPVERVNLRVTDSNGNYDNYEGNERIKQGRVILVKENDLEEKFESYEKVLIVPVLMGRDEDGEDTPHVCEDRYGVEVRV
jgi:hypothetical protein